MSEIADDLRWLQANMHVVSVEINEHRSDYRTAAEQLSPKEWGYRYHDDEFGSLAIKQACIDTDTLISVQVYPLTPVGFCMFHGAEVGEVIHRARTVMEEPP